MMSTASLSQMPFRRERVLGGVLAAGGVTGLAYALRIFWDVLPWFFSTSSVSAAVSNLVVYVVAMALVAALTGVGAWLLARRWWGARGVCVLVGGVWVVGQLVCGVRCLTVFGLQWPDATVWPLYVPAAMAVTCALLWVVLVRSWEVPA